MKISFGEYIRNLRTSEGLTLTQLGAQLNIDSANLSKIENGKRGFDEKRLQLLSKTFGLNFDELKREFYSDLFAKKIYENDCSIDALTIAEEKVRYLRLININEK
jgi:transcriptional regulator with XRE-family HTH domain